MCSSDLDRSLKFLNPGSPIVCSNGSRDAIVWVLDANLFRSVSLIGPATPHPEIYAINGATLAPIWHSTADQLNVGGKYSTPLVAHGVVFAATDRIQAFGLRQWRDGRRLYDGRDGARSFSQVGTWVLIIFAQI